MSIRKFFLIFVILFCFSSVSYAYDFSSGSCQEVLGSELSFAKSYVQGGDSTNCQTTANAIISTVNTQITSAGGGYSENCTPCVDYDPSNCIAFAVYWICTNSFVATLSSGQGILVAEQTVSGVTMGGESDAAAAAVASWKENSNNPYPSPPSGMTTTSQATAYVYSYGLSTGNNNTSDVKVIMWKQAGFSSTSTVVPLDGLVGNNGTSGLTQSQTTTAVQNGTGNALSSAGLTGTGVQNAISAGIHDAKVNGDLPSGGGGGGIPTDSNGHVPVDWNNNNSLKASDVQGLNGSYTGGDASGHSAYSSSLTTSSFSSTWSEIGSSFGDFKTNIQGTALYGMIGSFFDPANIGSGSAPDMSIETTYYGNHTFNLSSYSSVFLVLRSVVLIIFAYASFRVVMRGGAG